MSRHNVMLRNQTLIAAYSPNSENIRIIVYRDNEYLIIKQQLEIDALSPHLIAKTRLMWRLSRSLMFHRYII